jgi:chromosome partitioning protein
MKTLALLSQKGGSGKSTLAVHLAVIAQAAGRRTVLIDLDPQRSAAGWWDTRTADTPEMVESTPGELPAVLDAARTDGVAFCVIDTRPSAGTDAATAAALADLVLIPTRPAIFDLKAIGATVDIVAGTKIRAFIVLNGTPASRGFGEAATTADARRALADYAIPVAPISIGLRAALAHALVDGRAVNEFDPAGKAAQEMNNLWLLTEKHLWPNAPPTPWWRLGRAVNKIDPVGKAAQQMNRRST